MFETLMNVVTAQRTFSIPDNQAQLEQSPLAVVKPVLSNKHYPVQLLMLDMQPDFVIDQCMLATTASQAQLEESTNVSKPHPSTSLPVEPNSSDI